MRSILIASLLALATTAAWSAPTLIAEWDFNAMVAGQNPITVSPSSQVFFDPASMFWLSGTTFAASGARSTHYTNSTDKSSDPAAGPSPNNYAAYNTEGYDVAGDKSVWQHSTAGYKNIFVEFDYRRSSTTPVAFQWALSQELGDTWVYGPGITLVDDLIWHNNNSSGLLPAVYENNPGFAVAVSVANSGGNPLGTLRFDMLQIYGDPIPEPGTILVLSAGVGAMVAYIRRRRS